MCLQEIFILWKQSLWVGLYCNNHPSQHKLNTSFSICFYLPSSWASFMSSIWTSGVRWAHLSLKQWKVSSVGVVPRTLLHRFAALGPRGACVVPVTGAGSRGFISWHPPSPPRLPTYHALLWNVLCNVTWPQTSWAFPAAVPSSALLRAQLISLKWCILAHN